MCLQFGEHSEFSHLQVWGPNLLWQQRWGHIWEVTAVCHSWVTDGSTCTRPSVGLSESLASNPAQGGLNRRRLGVTPDAYTRRTTVSLVGLCESRASSPCFGPEELEIKEGTTGKETMEKPTKALCHLPTFHWKLGRAKL